MKFASVQDRELAAGVGAKMKKHSSFKKFTSVGRKEWNLKKELCQAYLSQTDAKDSLSKYGP